MHRTVATVAAGTIDDAVRAVAASQDASLVEVRLDALWPTVPDPDEAATHLERLLAAAPAPLLATLRPARQGGSFDGPEEVRIGLLEAAARSGFAMVDVENDLAAMAPLLHHLSKATRRIVLSNHLAEAPDRQLGSQHLTAMQDLGGTLHKIAFPAPDLPAMLRALELAWLHANRRGAPALQPLGAAPAARALLALAGNHATYGAAPGTTPAPGQPPLDAVLAVWRHWGIDPHAIGTDPAPWYAVLGDPIEHSLSPRIHNAAATAAGAPPRFGALPVPATPGMLRLVSNVAPRIGLAGASVTSPLKEVLPTVAAPDAVAQSVGAANCLWFDDGPRCTNTDALAFLHHTAGAAHILVLGAGGAAAAAAWAAHEHGGRLSVSARDPAKAEALAARFGGTAIGWSDRHSVGADLVVQCTPAIDAWQGPAPPRAIELVYAAPTTLAATERDGLVDGRTFLVDQAVHASRRWTGTDPDRAAMVAALGL